MARPSVQLVSQADIEAVIERARQSPRRRANHNLHDADGDPVHRFLNVLTPGTYVTPHRHVTPPKSETFLVMRGEIAMFLFDDAGKVTTACRLAGPDQHEHPMMMDLMPGVWHSLTALSETAVCFEVKPGPWVPATDKEFAPFAPREGVDSPEACRRYLEGLLAQLP